MNANDSAMIPSDHWRAVQREAQLAAEQIAMGVTTLGRANHAQTGLYSQAFFGLSIGLERLGKLIIVADYAIQNRGSFPTNDRLKDVKHDLVEILAECEKIAGALDPGIEFISRPSDGVHNAIVRILSSFAIRSRYYNLDYLTGAACQQTDPILMWWEHVAMPICEQCYSKTQRVKHADHAVMISTLTGSHIWVGHHAEDGAPISTVGDLFSRADATKVVQKYSRLYVLQIVRWLAAILFELSFIGASKKLIEPLTGLREHFAIFMNNDRYFRNRKTWSIYRP